MSALTLQGNHIFGVDVSHHQVPAALKWDAMKAAGCEFAVMRLVYGTMADRAAREHIARARDSGVRIGAYLFYRASQPVQDQFEAFLTAAKLAGYGRPEDIVACLDLEDDTASRPLEPKHAEGAETLATLLKLHYGRTSLLYITQRDWGRIGKPEWCLHMPQWTAHYSAPSRVQPATPNGMPYTWWQSRVGKFDPKGPHGFYKDESPQIDHNHAKSLPLLSGETIHAPIDPLDVMGSERHIEDTDRTHEKRARVLESILRAEAGFHATEAYYSMLDQSRRDAHREMAGLEPRDTEPPSDNADTDRPPPESNS